MTITRSRQHDDHDVVFVHMIRQGQATARSAVRDLMAALDVAIVTIFEVDAEGALFNSRSASVLEGMAARHLARARQDRLVPSAGPGGRARVEVDGPVLLCAFADETGEIMGAIAVRATEGPPDDDLTERFDRAARLVELHMQNVASKLELELDLAAARTRINRLERLNRTDPLTGLENKTSFKTSFESRMDSEQGTKALILMDIDHFKAINDLYGHTFGDTVLRTLANALATALPDSATIGRLGGDEFGILLDLPDRGRAYLEGVMDRCRSAVLRGTAMLGKPDLGKVSLGAAIYPEHASTYEMLFEMADSALYKSKGAGRGQQTIYTQGRDQAFSPREIGERFRVAVQEGCILPWFQPVYDLSSGICTGFEMLARWSDSDYGVLTPEQFPGIFADHTHAEVLTRTLMEQGLDEIARLTVGLAQRPSLAINLTTFDLINPEFVFDLQMVLSDNPELDWSMIIIEVTENIMMGARDGQVFRSLKELRRRGARVALDDFGTGYGGLRHLSGWPVDILKIDRTFVQRMGDNEVDAAIVESILGLSRRAGFSVVAEGIETRDQLRILADLGCGEAQGYLLSPPVPADGLTEAARTLDLSALMPPRAALKLRG